MTLIHRRARKSQADRALVDSGCVGGADRGPALIPPVFVVPLLAELRRDNVLDFRSEEQKLRDEFLRRLDMEFLGLDPDYRSPRWKAPLFVYRRWRRNLPTEIRGARQRVAKSIAPWLMDDWEASDRYAEE